MRIRKSPKVSGNLLNILLLAVVALTLVFGIFMVRIKLLQNAQRLGEALVHSYALEEELNIHSLQTNLLLAGQFLDEIIDSGGNSTDIQAWLSGYFTKFTDIIGKDMVDFYAVIDGEIVAANPWVGDSDYQYAQTDWYRSAIDASGQVVQGAVFLDAVTGQKVFTISKALERSGDVLAMDVYVQNASLHNSAHTLPEDCSYFLCDDDGELMYSSTKWNIQPQDLQNYADYIMAGIADGSLLSYDSFVQDPEGVSRGVYYQQMDNGWTVIMTIPVQSILLGEQGIVVYLMAVLAVIMFFALAFMSIQDAVKRRIMKKADDTIHMLGDSFYSIYRVNVQTGNYESIKIYQDLLDKIPEKGAYSMLLQTMRLLVKPSTFRIFETSFSLESIRQRIAQGIADYGGDYQRQFGDTYRWVNIRTLYNRDLAPDEVILCFRDVDEEKRRELQNTIILQDALDAAQKSTKAKSEFFSSMSHDMRTPLNAIIGCCSLAEKSHAAGDDSKVWDYIKKIQFSGSQLLDLINDILELSRMEAGKHNLDQRELNLKELLLNTADIFQDRAREEGKTLDVTIDFREDIVIGDEKKLIQIINNLLSNAMKYSDPGDSIRLDAKQFDFQQHSKYQIVVEDTGIGMSPAFLEHLFDPYSRETVFSAHPAVGTGLGMSIVKSLVQQMSGEISVDSKLGEGSRFTVTIPLKVARLQKASGTSPALSASQADFDWTAQTILVAEDNELNREIVTEILQQMGAKVLLAVNGEQAVQMFLTAPPCSIDAILMDMQMPVMDGCQAAQAIRHLNREDALTVPIIAVTANAFAEDIARTTQAGMNDHISKPIDSTLLSRTLQKLISAQAQYRCTSEPQNTGGRADS